MTMIKGRAIPDFTSSVLPHPQTCTPTFCGLLLWNMTNAGRGGLGVRATSMSIEWCNPTVSMCHLLEKILSKFPASYESRDTVKPVTLVIVQGSYSCIMVTIAVSSCSNPVQTDLIPPAYSGPKLVPWQPCISNKSTFLGLNTNLQSLDLQWYPPIATSSPLLVRQ